MIAPSNQYIAVLDTCVLAPMPLCDTLLRLAEDPAFYIPKWSDDILRELQSTLQRMGYAPVQAGRRLTAMETAFEDANVTGYERLVASMTNDPKDRHVLAAAVRCGADAIVTENVKHFPMESTKLYDLEVLTPDDFLVDRFHLNQDLLAEKVAAQAVARGLSLADLLARLSKWAPRAVRLLAAMG
ncbi:MAG: putative toxin-antitoxin system toxin component, PIN family [Bryobacteraceae bacterium]